MSKADNPKITTTSGQPPTIQDGPAPEPIDPKTGQHKAYWVLTKEERTKGFVRPVRRSYIHVGPLGPKYPLRDLTHEQHKRYDVFNYVKYEEYPTEAQDKTGALGRFWTQEQLDKIGHGCGTVTTMSLPLAETYARDNSFYGATFCCGCKQHFPVNEFIWDGTKERVGS